MDEVSSSVHSRLRIGYMKTPLLTRAVVVSLAGRRVPVTRRVVVIVDTQATQISVKIWVKSLYSKAECIVPVEDVMLWPLFQGETNLLVSDLSYQERPNKGNFIPQTTPGLRHRRRAIPVIFIFNRHPDGRPAQWT